MPEEKNVSEGDEDDFLQECVLEGVDGMVNEFAAVVKGLDCNARRQAWLDLGDLFLDAFDDGFGIFPSAHDDGATDGFMTI